MQILLLIGILAINLFISWRNCVSAGMLWKDTMSMGSTFDKVLIWCSVIQSWIGFSMPFVLIFGWIGGEILSGQPGGVRPVEVEQFWAQVGSLWYLAIIFPALASGILITLESIKNAYQKRDFGSLTRAGWNSFAQIHNMMGAFRNIGPAISNVGTLFRPMKGRGGGKGKAVLFVIIVVVLALAAGGIITFALIRHYSGRTRSRLEVHADALERTGDPAAEGGVYARGSNADGSFRYTMG